MNTMTKLVNDKLNQWENEAASHFCQIMQKGGSWQYVQYPTGLVLIEARIGNEKAEIHKETAKRISRKTWTLTV